MPNRAVAAAWDEVEAFAVERGGVLAREVDGFAYRWAQGDRRAHAWVADDVPRYGLRLDPAEADSDALPLSLRAWNFATIVEVLHAVVG